MNKSIYAIICILLIISSPVTATFGYGAQTEGQDPRDLGEALTINVDHINPTPITSDLFQHRAANIHVFLSGKTAGTMLFGDMQTSSGAPFYGDMKIRHIDFRTDPESSKYIQGGLPILIRPKGEELIVDSNGNIDLGYTTVRLKRQPIEDKVPEEIIIDVAAKIYFDVESGFGMLSTQSFNLVAQPNEEAWLKSLADSTLWGGKGYIRVLDINANTARVQVYDANKRKTGISNIVKLIEGAEPKEIMLPGAPSMLENRINIKLERVSNNENSATLLIQEEIGNETLSTTKTYVKGMKLNSEWSVKQIYSEGIVLMNSDFDEVYLKYGGASEVVNPCGNFSPLEIDELTNATSTQLYCQAIEEYRSALSLSQTSGDKALFNLYIGNTYLKLNSWEKAAKYFQKCIDVGSPSEANTCKGNLATTKEIAKDNYNSIPIDNSLVVLKEINTGSKQNSIMYQTLENYGDPINTLVSGTINDYLSNETLEDEMGNRYKWIIKSINAEEVVIEQEFTWTVNRALPTEKTRTLELGKKIQVPFGTQNKFIYIDKISISESAVITVSPGTRDNYGTSHFQIHLPIEKRLWQWTPEEIDNMIESTDKTLNKLDGIIENLGNIISTWKGVCFATFATLTVKNAFFSNPARRMIETRFRADCKSNTSTEEAAIDCFKNKESEIDNLVKTSKTEEEELKNAFKDADFSDEESLKKIASKLDGINETELVNLNKYQGITGQDLYTSMYETAVFNNTKLDIKQEVATANKIGKAVNKEIDNKPVSEKERAEIERKYILNMGEGNAEKSSDALFANQDERAKEVLDEVNIITTNDGNPLQVYTKEDGTKYIINAEGEQVTVTPIMDGGKVLSSSKGDFYNSTDKTYLAGLAQGALSTNYGTVPRIYFDKDTKKPVLIPFQLKNNKDKKLGYANYIYVDEEEGRQGGYKFSIWNPGPDRLPNTKDDKGIKYSSQLHPDKRLKENEDLAREVERTYQQAVSLAGKKDGTTVEFNGIKVILQKEYQGNIGKSLNSDGVCTDSMSELDCKILFNVCDPVMCPPSRFNFGGKWDMGAQVGSVVQKGIVGSLVLGWGNGDILPICLTGIHAGLENIHSMFGGFRDCLEVAKTSGDSVGICNEIRSLYMCNILWEETLALVNVFGKLQGWLSVKIFGSGGGEYKLWDSSWKRMGESVNFFTKSYATSAFAAFTSRSSDEVGSELCKAAIFGRTPAGGDLLGQLTSPESPPQFTGWFEEDRFTDVNLQSGLIKTQATTGTGQSTYRIFYHIYAGRNKDIRYRVVLKNINGQVMAVNDPGLYQGERLLKKGDSVDQSFTLPNLPPGFIEMCIIIDGVPECGFGSTSSGFSTQYLKDKMIKSSLNDHIDTAEECVPRDRSYIPGLFTSGVKRVCAAYDPDSVGGEWEFVGTCGQDDIGRELGNCYLYSKGIEASLHDTSYNLSKIIPDSQTNHNYTQGQGQDETDEIQDLVNSSAQSEYEELILRFTKQKNKEGRINLISDFRSLINRTLSDEIKIDSHDLIATNLLILAENKKLEDLPSRENGEIENLMIKYDFDVVNGWSAFHLKFESDIWKINDKEVIGDSNNWHSVGEIDGNIFGRDERELSTNLKNENFKNGLNIILDFLNNETRKDDWIEIYKDGKSIKKFDNGEHIKNNVQYSALYASITSVSNNNDIIPDKNYGYQRKMIEIKGDGSSREIDCFGFIRRSGHSQEKQSIIKRFSNLFKSEPKLSYQKLIPYAENIYDLSEDMGDLSHEEAEMYIQTKIGCIRQDLINQEQACERNQENELADATIKLLKEGSEILNKSEQITSNTCTNFDKKLAGDNTYIYKCISDSRAQACIEITGKELPEFDIPKNNSLYLICSQEKQQSLINLGTQIYCECSGLDIDKKAELAKAIIETKEKTPTKDIHEAIQFAKNNEIENKKCDCKGNCDDYETLIETYSKEVGIDPHLALSLIMEESGCNQKATSNTGARGLMQITKTTFNEICKDEFEKIENIEGLSNYKNNLACGFKILKHKYDDNKDGLKQSWAYENSQSAKSNLDACFASYPKYESYKDWDAAMRAYNTQACDNSANVNYVEEINAIHAALTTKKTQPQKSSIKEITIKEWEKWGKGTKKECDTDMQDELTNYWKAVGWKTTEWGCDTHAWSAAFISYIMKESGISKFPVNIAHAKYFKAIRDDNVDYGCKTYSMSDIDKLKEGDLICRNRDSKTPDYNNISDATHCDIITKLTKDSNGTIILRKQIGGNRAGETSAVCGTNGGCTVYQSTHMSAPQSKDYFGFISCQETKEEETSTRKVARNCDGLNNRLGLLFNSEDKDVCNVYTNCYTEQKKILFTTRHKCMECADLVDCNDIYNVDQYGFNICTDSSLVCGI